MTTRRRTAARLCLRVCLAAAATAVLAEITVRMILFGHALDGLPGVARLQHPSRLGNPAFHDEYWTGVRRIHGATAIDDVPVYDAVLGWTGVAIAPGTYEHHERALLRGRRPVLLYGDSFANCTTPPEDCFQSLMERSDLAWGHALLNHGVGGYGLDQIYLLLDRTLDRYLELEPLVLVSLLVDDDIDRAALSYRVWPKPRLELHGGELRLEQQPVPRMAEVFGFGSGLESQAWRVLVHGTTLLPKPLRRYLRGEARIDARKRELGGALLAAIERRLAERGVPHAFVLFYGQQAVRDPAWGGWRDPFVEATLDALGARRISMRDAFNRECAATGEALEQYFDQLPSGPGHPNARGNEVAFAAMREALIELGARPMSAGGPELAAARVDGTELRGPTAAVRYQAGVDENFSAEEATRFVARAGPLDQIELSWTLGGRAQRFRARARVASPTGNADRVAEIELEWIADGEQLGTEVVRVGEPARRVSVALAERAELRLRIRGRGEGREPALLVLAEPFFD